MEKHSVNQVHQCFYDHLVLDASPVARSCQAIQVAVQGKDYDTQSLVLGEPADFLLPGLELALDRRPLV